MINTNINYNGPKYLKTNNMFGIEFKNGFSIPIYVEIYNQKTIPIIRNVSNIQINEYNNINNYKSNYLIKNCNCFKNKKGYILTITQSIDNNINISEYIIDIPNITIDIFSTFAMPKYNDNLPLLKLKITELNNNINSISAIHFINELIKLKNDHKNDMTLAVFNNIINQYYIYSIQARDDNNDIQLYTKSDNFNMINDQILFKIPKLHDIYELFLKMYKSRIISDEDLVYININEKKYPINKIYEYNNYLACISYKE